VADRPAVIQATFADWRTVKGRKALQLVFEVPLEQQADVLSILGAPLPDNPVWCAVARLNAEVSEPPKQKDDQRSERAREAYRMKDEMEKACVRAGMLPKDRRFQKWIGAVDADDAARRLRLQCDVTSRSEIATDERAYREFLKMETAFQMDTGLLPSPR
jgi:hypothetical protein